MKVIIEQEFKELVIYKIGLLQRRIDKNIKGINNGGCGRFALRAHRALNKMGIRSEMQVCLSDWKGNSVEANKALLSNLATVDINDKQNLSFVHAWLYLPDFDISFDGETMQRGEWNGDDYWGDYTEKEMSAIIRVGLWNPTYRVSQNRKLSRLVYGTLKL